MKVPMIGMFCSSIADKRLILRAGWHSAMAQGHALSVLTRAYVVTNDMKYLQVAKRALDLFKTVSELSFFT